MNESLSNLACQSGSIRPARSRAIRSLPWPRDDACPRTFSPLAHRAFLLILVGSLLSNFGNAIQSVGAAWQLTIMRQPADVIALVQTATNLPIMLLALPAGAWADMFDKRTIMLLAQTGMFAMSLLLVVLAFAGMTPPVAIIGADRAARRGRRLLQPGAVGLDRRDRAARRAGRGGGAQHPRVQRRAQPRAGVRRGDRLARRRGQRVRRQCAELPDGDRGAVALAARAAPPKERRALHAVIAEGFRFAARSPQIRTIMLRAFTFTTTGAAAWALMPLVASDCSAAARRSTACCSARSARARCSARRPAPGSARASGRGDRPRGGMVYGLGCLGVAYNPGLCRRCFALLVLAGAGWVQALSGFSVAGQLWSPREIVGRITARSAA